MASSSFHHHSQKIKSYAHSRIYDVFINHRGPDVKETLGLQLYNSLLEFEIGAFLDSDYEIELGDSCPPTVETVIRSASVHIAIFSKRYAESARCLAELDLMVKSKAKIIPVFYEVEPWELRYIEKGVYADAFSKFKSKDRYLDKLEDWKEALQHVSFMTTYYDFNKHKHSRYALCKILANAVLKEMEKKKSLHIANNPSEIDEMVENKKIVENEKTHPLDVTKYPVGLDELVKDFETYCGQEKANIIGIYGMGGSGKTTLAKQLFNLKRSHYDGSCFLFDVAETELASLKSTLVKDLFRGDFKDIPKLQNTGEGTSDHIADSKAIPKGQSTGEVSNDLRNHLIRGRFLHFFIVLDDIDQADKLNALLHKDALNSGSLAIVTTRDEGVLKRAGIVHRYALKHMNVHHSRELFCWHAIHRADPPVRYEDLVRRFVIACGGLPLSLEVLGGHVFGRDKRYWEIELNKLYNIFRGNIDLEKFHTYVRDDLKLLLKISFDALDTQQKQIFMDIACFFIGQPKAMAIKIWEGSGWSAADQSLQTLQDKSLVELVREEMDESKEVEFGDRLSFRMHFHLRDLGRQMADKLSSPRRQWRTEYLESSKFNGFQKVLIESNEQCFRCFNSILDWSIGIKYFLGNSDGNAGTLLLWLELDLQHMLLTSIPQWIPLQNLRGLKICNGGLKSLWESDVQAPSQLKKLVLYGISFSEELKSIEMLHCLEDLVLSGDLLLTATMVMEGSSLSGSLKKLTNLKHLVLRHFTISGELQLSNDKKPTYPKPVMSSLKEIEIITIVVVSKVSVCGEYCPSLETLKISGTEDLIEVDLTRVTTLNCLMLEYCTELKTVSGISDLKNLEMLNLVGCPNLEKLPRLAHMSCLERISVDNCPKLQNLEGIEVLQRLKYIHISKVTGPIPDRPSMLNTIHSLQRLPSVISVIGRAVSGAESALNANLFSYLTEPAAVTEIPSASLKTPDDLSAIIVCIVIPYLSESLLIEIPIPPNHSIINGHPIPDRDRQWTRLPPGEWNIVTIAISGDYAPHYLAQYSWITSKWNKEQKGVLLTVNKGEELRTAYLFKEIINQLYYEFKK